MSPRKRIRTNISDKASPAGEAANTSVTQPNNASDDLIMARSPDSSEAPSVAEGSSNISRGILARESTIKRQRWYGSWPQAPKSAASTQLATETILGGTLKLKASPDFERFGTRKTVVDADGIIVIASSKPHQSEPADLPPIASPSAASPKQTEDLAASGQNSVPVIPNSTDETRSAQKIAEGPDTVALRGIESPAPIPTAAASGWLSWLGRSAHVEEKSTAPDAAISAPANMPEEDEGQRSSELQDAVQREAALEPAVVSRPTAGGIWSYLWNRDGRSPSSATAQQKAQQTAQDSEDTVGRVSGIEGEQQDLTMEEAPSAPIPVPAAPSAPNGGSRGGVTGTPDSAAAVTASAGSTWAFWSRDARPKVAGKASSPLEQGEVAIIGERSEADPKPATGVEVNGTSSKASSLRDVPTRDTASRETSRKGKRLRPLSMEVSDEASSRPASPRPEALPKGESATSASSKQAAAIKPPQVRVKTPPANLLLPSFRSTYHLKENTSIVRQITRLLLRTNQPPAKHVFLTTDPPKIKKAVAIGVHGLFPAAYLRPMIGQPTGTSIRFANHGAEAVRRWADRHGCQSCEIEKIALEGEGKIAERVDNLWKLLLNWIDHVQNADFIMLACHSQGVPVGIMLLAKLIDLGIVTRARIGVCAMAGVSLGPFPDYKSGLGILMGSAGELWDFANPESDVSKRYEHSLKTVLEYGVRVTYVGSIDDQVVPLESAIYSPAHHPYVYRAVFVDGRMHAPDFIAHLVGFACKLRNLGISDHGLIRELSMPLAGSLYSGEGHSRVYDDSQVYDLATSHALETADMGHIACEVRERGYLANPNPYHLPWIMRGLLEEDFVKTDLHDETAELLKQFDEWKPVTKALKDVKYRLEAVRSKL